ncbi:MAG: hypothetical protein ACHQWV_04700 [Nitrospirales bacterium]
MEEPVPSAHMKPVLRPSASVLFSLVIVLLVFGSAIYILGFYLK